MKKENVIVEVALIWDERNNGYVTKRYSLRPKVYLSEADAKNARTQIAKRRRRPKSDFTVMVFSTVFSHSNSFIEG